MLRQSSYFNDEFIELKLVLSVLPIPLTATTITMLRPAAMMQYSIAVAPDSSPRNLEISFCIQNSCSSLGIRALRPLAAEM
jgi:hypothetical protein